MRRCVTLFFSGVIFASSAATSSSGITIDLVYRAAGQSLPGFGTATAAPPNAVGNGTIQSVVEAAAAYWESAIEDAFTLTVEYGWFPRDGSTGTHILLEEGGNPHRETRAAVAFDSDGSTAWWRDPTPGFANEFNSTNTITRNLGGGTMTTGIRFGGPTGLATRRDLLTTAMHEIGHALGLSSANDAFQIERTNNFVDLTTPLPFAGAEIPLNLSSAHLDLNEALMKSNRPNGVRRHASEADILSNAQISQFTQVNLQPSFPEFDSVDFDGDGNVNVVDLNMLLDEGPVAPGVTVNEVFNGLFDLNEDEVIDLLDVDVWLSEAADFNGLAAPYLVGDANLDGLVDGLDFIDWNDFKFTGSNDWDRGDFNGDGLVDGLDFIAWNDNKFMASDVTSNAPFLVPEPSWLLWQSLWLAALMSRYR